MKKFEKMAVKICTCGALNTHVYFYADLEIEQSRLPVSFDSIELVEMFLDAHLAREFISAEQKAEMMKVAREANLKGEKDPIKEFFITALVQQMG